MRTYNEPDVLSQALAEPSRRALLENLRFGEKTVSQLVEATGLKQPNVSNHLAKMKQQGIVRSERIGRQVYYSLFTPFADVLLQMHAMAAHSAPVVPSRSPGVANGQETSADVGRASVHAPFDAMPQASEAEAEASRAAQQDTAVAQLLAQCRKAYFNAIMAGDEEQALALINTLVARRLPMETIYLEVFAQSINHIGELYRQGLTDEAHEHMASAITERIMARVAQFYMPVARVSYRALLGCVAGNWHELGLRMLADGLKTLGWETIFLGANVPTASFISMAAATKPDLVVASCAMREHADAARELLNGLAEMRSHLAASSFQIAVGGPYFLEHTEEVAELPVDFTAVDMQQFLNLVQERFSNGKARL